MWSKKIWGIGSDFYNEESCQCHFSLIETIILVLFFVYGVDRNLKYVSLETQNVQDD